MKVKSRNRKLALAVAVVVVVAFCCFSETLSLGQWIYDHSPKIFIWNDTYSVPRGLYLILPNDKLSVGDYVVFSGTPEIRELAVSREWLPKEANFLKKIGGLYGDSFRADPTTNMFYVNNNYIGLIKDKDSKGRHITSHVYGLHTVGEEEFLPVGDSPNSFDGRYYGTQPLSTIKYRVIPVFITD